jgi:hypothetical protein
MLAIYFGYYIAAATVDVDAEICLWNTYSVVTVSPANTTYFCGV